MVQILFFSILIYLKFLKYLELYIFFWIAFNLIKSHAKIYEIKITKKAKISLVFQGFITSITNPKTWIFILSILPSFLRFHTSVLFLTSMILLIEFCSLNLYALGGSFFKIFMNKHLSKLNKISALCIIILAIGIMLD
ncbi:LysE family transporter [Campylobacter sp. RM9939]|nr:LysE family transporter [Campylobacter sp. RM9939]